MSDFFLDLRDKLRVVDFLADHLEFASSVMRREAEKWIQSYHDGKKVPTDRLAEIARRFAWAIWPARVALKRFFETQGSEEEWRRVLASIRPSTAHLLKRFRVGVRAATLDEVLQHAESDVALREGERIEIGEVRAHLRQDYWRDNKKSLAALVTDSEREVNEYQERLAKLRELALALSRGFQDEIFSKIARFEDRILFEGEVVPLEILDEEIKYYTEQKEISPVD